MPIRESRRQREARPRQPYLQVTPNAIESHSDGVRGKRRYLMLDRLITELGGKAMDGACVRHAV